MKKILIVLAGVIAALLIIAALMPKDFRIEKEVTVNKPVAHVFGYLKMVKNGNEWNPWMKKGPNTDPSGVQTFKGEDGTVGFINSWSSDNKEVGVGEEEITAIVPNEKVELQLRLAKPYKANHKVYLITKSIGENQTSVTWAMEGRTEFPFNLACFFMRKEVEKNFEEGLNNLKEIIEKQSSAN